MLKYYVYILIRLNTITYYYNISFVLVLLKFIDFSFFFKYFKFQANNDISNILQNLRCVIFNLHCMNKAFDEIDYIQLGQWSIIYTLVKKNSAVAFEEAV